MIHTRLGCSTISFRHLDLDAALATITDLGFAEIDLGALPGVCDHVPYVLDSAAVDRVAAEVTALRSTSRACSRRLVLARPPSRDSPEPVTAPVIGTPFVRFSILADR